jgi:hypothetical protein
MWALGRTMCWGFRVGVVSGVHRVFGTWLCRGICNVAMNFAAHFHSACSDRASAVARPREKYSTEQA